MRRGAPTTSAWREEALTRAAELDGLAAWIEHDGAGARKRSVNAPSHPKRELPESAHRTIAREGQSGCVSHRAVGHHVDIDK